MLPPALCTTLTQICMQYFLRAMDEREEVAIIYSSRFVPKSAYLWCRIEAFPATGPVNSHVYECCSSQEVITGNLLIPRQTLSSPSPHRGAPLGMLHGRARSGRIFLTPCDRDSRARS